ncbi:unnamed protein product, partial [Sphagnum tenellum]
VDLGGVAPAPSLSCLKAFVLAAREGNMDLVKSLFKIKQGTLNTTPCEICRLLYCHCRIQERKVDR